MKMDFATGVCDGKIGVDRTGAGSVTTMSQNAEEQFKHNSNKQETYSKAHFFHWRKIEMCRIVIFYIYKINNDIVKSYQLCMDLVHRLCCEKL